MKQKARAFGRVDANQPDIVKFIRKMGGSWQGTHQIPGALDGWIGYRGIDQRAEIKDPDQPLSKRKLTDAEQDVFDEWRGRRPVVIETESDVTALFHQIAKELTK